MTVAVGIDSQIGNTSGTGLSGAGASQTGARPSDATPDPEWAGAYSSSLKSILPATVTDSAQPVAPANTAATTRIAGNARTVERVNADASPESRGAEKMQGDDDSSSGEDSPLPSGMATARNGVLPAVQNASAKSNVQAASKPSSLRDIERAFATPANTMSARGKAVGSLDGNALLTGDGKTIRPDAKKETQNTDNTVDGAVPIFPVDMGALPAVVTVPTVSSPANTTTAAKSEASAVDAVGGSGVKSFSAEMPVQQSGTVAAFESPSVVTAAAAASKIGTATPTPPGAEVSGTSQNAGTASASQVANGAQASASRNAVPATDTEFLPPPSGNIAQPMASVHMTEKIDSAQRVQAQMQNSGSYAAPTAASAQSTQGTGVKSAADSMSTMKQGISEASHPSRGGLVVGENTAERVSGNPPVASIATPASEKATNSEQSFTQRVPSIASNDSAPGSVAVSGMAATQSRNASDAVQSGASGVPTQRDAASGEIAMASATTEAVASTRSAAGAPARTVSAQTKGEGVRSLTAQMEGDPAALLREAGSAPVVHSSSGDTGSVGGVAHTVHDTFAALDSTPSVSNPSWVRTTPGEIEAGFHDNDLGWVSVRATNSGGEVHASVVPGSENAAQTLSGHMEALNNYLADHHAPVESVTLSAPVVSAASSSAMAENNNPGSGSGQESATQGSFSQNMQQGSGQRNADGSEQQVLTSRVLSPLSVGARNSHTDVDAAEATPGWTPNGGRYISVMA